MRQQRQTSKFKAQVVLELLKGETLEELSRKYAVTVSEINTWRDEFIQNGTDGFKRKPRTPNCRVRSARSDSWNWNSAPKILSLPTQFQ